ncbi:MAG: type IV conjugative transfer system protein TraL [Gammaproteobacteria bacterium]|nr:type IV conjugative transfer system protein TraL [Gammaproteobacteria bacterium]
MQQVRIPSRIDDPPHLLMWSLDEMAPILIGLTFGIFIGQALILTLAGLVLTNFYRRFRDNNPDGYMLHMLYNAGFLPPKGKLMINPYIKRFFP